MTGQLSVLSTAKTFEIKLKLRLPTKHSKSWRLQTTYTRDRTGRGRRGEGRGGEGRVNWKVQSSDESEKTMLVVKSSCHGRFFISANFTFLVPTKNSVKVV